MGGDDSVRALPVPIPNTEVKPHCADGTAGVTLWESRTSPPTPSVPLGLSRLAPWSYSVGIPPTQLTESQGVIRLAESHLIKVAFVVLSSTVWSH